MKNKKNIYILLPAVIIIWGLLGYRIFSTVSPKTNVQQRNTAYNFTPKPIEEQESFTIKANYQDPFLCTMEIQKKVKQPVKVQPVTSKEPFPAIVYKGLVSGSGNHNPVYIISVNGQQYFFKRNAIHENVKLVKGTNKVVVLRFQGQQQTFAIAK